MNIGILGTGFGVYHLELYKNIKQVNKIYIWGRNKEKLLELEKKFNVYVTTNIEEIFNNESIDMIDVCLPNELHKEYVIKTLQNKKHVFCETPITLSFEDANEIKKASIYYERNVFVDLFLRYEYPYQFLKESMSKNEYGNLRSLKVWRQTPPWWGNLGKNKIVYNLMMHDIDFISWILDKQPVDINVQSYFEESKGIINVNMNFIGPFVFLSGSSMMQEKHPFSVGYEAIFDKATIRYYEDGYPEVVDTKLKIFTDKEIIDVEMKNGNCYKKCLESTIDSIINNNPSINSINEACKSIELATLISSKL